MKLVILIPDGMCDVQYEELGGLSPAEYARTPGMDEMVRRGSVGLMKTMHDGLPLGSLVGIREYMVTIRRSMFLVDDLFLNHTPWFEGQS
ncbi:MAG: hypothetical protein IPN96_03375 [Anaerolineales bacterium]|nr:hypothetical protein [Anaerolineales bacterium]